MAKRSLTVRLTEAEHTKIENLSEGGRYSKTEIVQYALKHMDDSSHSIKDRTTILDALGEIKEAVRRLTVAINKIGRNINTIARTANKTGVVSEEDYKYSLKVLKSILSNQAKLRERLLELWRSHV